MISRFIRMATIVLTIALMTITVINRRKYSSLLPHSLTSMEWIKPKAATTPQVVEPEPQVEEEVVVDSLELPLIDTLRIE